MEIAGSSSNIASLFDRIDSSRIDESPVQAAIRELETQVSGLDSFKNGEWFAVKDTVAQGVYTIGLLQLHSDALEGLELRLKALSTYTKELSETNQFDSRYSELKSLITDIEREISWFVGFNSVAKTGEITIDLKTTSGSPVPITQVNYSQVGSLF